MQKLRFKRRDHPDWFYCRVYIYIYIYDNSACRDELSMFYLRVGNLQGLDKRIKLRRLSWIVIICIGSWIIYIIFSKQVVIFLLFYIDSLRFSNSLWRVRYIDICIDILDWLALHGRHDLRWWTTPRLYIYEVNHEISCIITYSLL